MPTGSVTAAARRQDSLVEEHRRQRERESKANEALAVRQRTGGEDEAKEEDGEGD